MKKMAILIALIVGLLGGYCLAQVRYEPKPPEGAQVPEVRDLPAGIERELKIPDLLLVAAYNKDGETVLFKPEKATTTPVRFPLQRKILEVSQASVLIVEGSKCMIYIPETTVAGKWYPEVCMNF